MTTYYYLNRNKSVHICGVDEWFEQMQRIKKSKNIAKTKIEDSFICTIFYGYSNNHIYEEPEIFETYVVSLNHKLSSHHRAYSTYEEAMIGHDNIVNLIKNSDKS